MEFYREACIDCIRYLGYNSIEDFDRLTIPDYELLMEGVAYRRTDQEYWAARVAWLSMSAQAKKKTGKSYRPVYKKFKQFFDLDKATNEVGNRLKRAKDKRK
jgi:hypothetical protein